MAREMTIRSRRIPPEPTRTQIINGLISLRRRGLLNGVWIDQDQIRVRRAGELIGRPLPIRWGEAAALIAVHAENARRK